MMDICDQAHKKAELDPAVIKASGFDTRTLQHSKGKYKSIEIDMIQYGATMGNSTETVILRYWFITKGLSENCVFYLDPLDDRARELQLNADLYVCGIKM